MSGPEKRRIRKVIHRETGLDIDSGQLPTREEIVGSAITAEALIAMREREWFGLRHDIEMSIQDGDHRYICGMCHGDVKIRAASSEFQEPHFWHVRDAKLCPWYVGNPSEEQVLAAMYRGIVESERHRRLKLRVHGLLAATYGAERVLLEQRVSVTTEDGGYEWRKPDIQVKAPIAGTMRHLAIELQVSSTFVKVIVERQRFYRKHGVHLLWIFDQDPEAIAKLCTSQKDIFYLNNANAFMFDTLMSQASTQAGELRLRCCTQRYDPERVALVDHREELSLENLVFDDERMLVYKVDGEAEDRTYQEGMRKAVEERACEERRLAEEQRRTVKRKDIIACIESLGAESWDEDTGEEHEVTQDEVYEGLASVLGMGGKLGAYQYRALCTIASLASGRVVGWGHPKIVSAFHQHFHGSTSPERPHYGPHRLLLVAAIRFYYREQALEYDQRRRVQLEHSGEMGKKATLVEMFQQAKREAHLQVPSASDRTFHACLRPIYPEVFAQLDAYHRELGIQQ
jgi:hypothetical protein